MHILFVLSATCSAYIVYSKSFLLQEPLLRGQTTRQAMCVMQTPAHDPKHTCCICNTTGMVY